MFTQINGKKRAVLFSSKSNKFMFFLPGFPKYPATNNFINFLINLNYNVLCPLYSGTFDSYGDFSIANCINDTKDWYDFINRGKYFLGPKKSLQTLKPSQIIFFSESFGSYILDLSLRKYAFDKVKKAIFLSPLISPHIHQNKKSINNARITSDLVYRNYPISYRFKNKIAFFNEISGRIINPLSTRKIKATQINALAIIGQRDKVTPKEMAIYQARDYQKFKLKIIKGGHGSAIDVKQAIKLIKNFLIE